jgi:peptide/nickel transport system permease protein
MTATVAPAGGRTGSASFWRSFRSDREGMTGLVILVLIGLVAIAAPLLANADGLSVTKATGPTFAPPSLDYPLGTDNNGRSVLTLVIWGSRISLLVGLAATLISMFIGTVVGVGAGHFGGSDGFLNRFGGGILNRLTEWFLVIPYLPLAIALMVVAIRYNLPLVLAVIIVIGITSWPSTARLVRAQTLAIEGRPYIERAKVLGAGHWHQMTRHVLPNVMPLVLANTTLTVSIAILAETTLSFLGVGSGDSISWGTIIASARNGVAMSNGQWWWYFFPGLAVVVVVRAFNMCGRALERILDPRLKERS